MLKKLIILTIALLPTASSFAAVNLIDNPGFEIQAGTNSADASYWQYGQPDVYGADWGTAARRDWGPHSGSWHGSIEGTWSIGEETSGGYLQRAAASPGMTYQASAWFYADTDWNPNKQVIKIEFFDANTNMLRQYEQILPTISTNWVQVTMSRVAPVNTVWVQFVAEANDVSSGGALRIDDVELFEIEPRTENFNLWTTTIIDGCHEFNGWNICTGRTTTINTRSGYAATLPAGSNYVSSPYFEAGLGNISFWYRHGSLDTNDEEVAAVSFAVQKSADGIIWATIESVTNVDWLSYQQYSKAFNEPEAHYIRIVHTGGSTNRLLIDDIAIAQPIPLTRYQDFNLWTNAQVNGCHTSNNWIVCTGRITTALAAEGFSATIAPSPVTGFTNYLRTPLMEGGYGTITFRYARGTNNTGAANLDLQSSPDGASWSSIASVSNIIGQSYSTFNQYFYHTNDAYLRIVNTVNTNGGTSPTLLDESFAGGTTPPPGWTFEGINYTYTSATGSGKEPPSLKFDTTDDRVITPILASPTNISFWMKGYSINPASEFKVEGWNGSTWIVIAAFTGISGSETTKSLNCPTNYTQIRFTYTKVSGNVAFDDLLITGIPPGPKPPQQLLLDQINIGEAELVRFQDFNSWPTMSTMSSTDSKFEGWTVHAGQVYAPTNAYDGQSARLDSPIGTYIQSPHLDGGLGTISFQYKRMYYAGSGDLTYLVQTSPDGTAWTTLDTLVLTPSMTSYMEYSRYIYETNKFYFRIYHSAITSQDAIFDDVQCEHPSSPANISLNGWHDPNQPYTNDAVSLWANVSSEYGAKNWTVTSYYRIGTSGAFTAISMQQMNITEYLATNTVPPQPNGTVVQYYMACPFEGPGSALTSPAYYPPGGPTNPASYGIPRAKPGQVWINEVSYDAWYSGYDFIEICGPAGFNISDWRVQLIDGSSFSFAQLGYYSISNLTLLPNDSQNHGFWVLGGTNIAARDMLLTNDLAFWYMPRPIGMRLLNEFGGIEYALSFQGAMPYFSAVPAYEDWDEGTGLGLSGTSTNYDGFAWVSNSVSPGTMNIGQLMDTNIPPFSVMEILDFQIGPTITILSTGTNYWNFTPWYSTNLAAPNAWIQVGTFNSTYSNGTNTITFTDPNLGGANGAYRVRATP